VICGSVPVLKPCPECKAEISTEAKACPHCGKPLPRIGDTLQQAGSGLCALGCLIPLLIIVWAILSSAFTHK